MSPPPQNSITKYRRLRSCNTISTSAPSVSIQNEAVRPVLSSITA